MSNTIRTANRSNLFVPPFRAWHRFAPGSMVRTDGRNATILGFAGVDSAAVERWYVTFPDAGADYVEEVSDLGLAIGWN
jgi:hypothetical protein